MPTSAESYFKAADGHRQAARILHPHVQQTSHGASSIFFAFYNVFGFALKLYFKANLAENGVPSSKLSYKPYGHDLHKLHLEATQRGLNSLSGLLTHIVRPNALEPVVQIVGPNHGSYTYRYVNDEDNAYTFIETMDVTFVIVDDLHEKVRRAIGL